MATLKFDGADDWVRGTGQGGMTGAHTWVALLSRGGTATNYQAMLGAHTSSNGRGAMFAFSNTTNPGRLSFYNNVSNAESVTNQIPTANTDWWLIAYSRAAGSNNGRWHGKNITTGAAAFHENGDIALADPPNAAGGYLKIGNYDLTPGTPGSAEEDFNGSLAIIAWWNANLSDAQFNELYANLRTSDLWNCSAGRPASLNELRSTTVVDLTGLMTWAAPNGATLTGADPPGWNFDGLGSSPTGRRAAQGRSGQGRSNLFSGSDTTPPGSINVTNVTLTRISRVVGKDATQITFTADEAFVEYMIRKVASASDTRLQGTLVEQALTSGTIARVQKATPVTSAVSGNSISITLPSNVAVGDHIIVFIGFSGALGVTVTNVVDQAGNTYAVDVLTDDGNATGAYSALASARCTSALTAGQTITATLSSSVTHRLISAAEYSGLASASWLDGSSNTGKGTSTSPASGTINPTGSNLLVIGATGYNDTAANHTPGASWTEIDDVSNGSKGLAVDERINVPAGAYQHTGTLAASVLWSDSIAAYKGASAGTQFTATITDDELIAAGAAEGNNLLKVFVKDAAGNWSA